MTDYFGPLRDIAFGVGHKFDYDGLMRWIEQQPLSLSKSVVVGGDLNITGDIYSSVWNGAIPANLATEDGTANAGYYLDSSEGGAQFEGNVYIGGSLDVSGDTVVTGDLEIGGAFTLAAGGSISSATSGTRWRLVFENPGFELPASMEFYSGQAAETAEGRLNLNQTVYLSNDGAEFNLVSPNFGAGTVALTLHSDETYRWITIGPHVRLSGTGSASNTDLAISGSTPDTGFYSFATDEIGIAHGGVATWVLRGNASSAVLEANVGHLYLDVIEVNHDIYLRTTNTGTSLKSRVFIDGSADSIILYDHDGGEVVNIGDGSATTLMTLKPAHGAGNVVLALNIERAWEFRQSGTGSSTNMKLMSTSNKVFHIGGDSNGDYLYVNTSVSSASTLWLNDGLTDVGNHETLRLDRGTGGTMRAVGYYSSWAHLKKFIQPLAKKNNRYWRREWFMDIEPVGYERKVKKSDRMIDSTETAVAADKERQIEMGFTIDNLIENTNLLTTKGERVGDSPDEYAILSVTVDYVQHLEQRVAELERLVASPA